MPDMWEAHREALGAYIRERQARGCDSNRAIGLLAN